MNRELPDAQVEFRKKGEEPEIRFLTFIESEKAREFQKTSTTASLTMLKSVCASQQTGKLYTRLPYLSLKKPVCGSRSNC